MYFPNILDSNKEHQFPLQNFCSKTQKVHKLRETLDYHIRQLQYSVFPEVN